MLPIQKDDERTFQAKIQQASNNINGSPRYFIYVTAPVKVYELNKGDKIVFSVKSKVDEPKKEDLKTITVEHGKILKIAPLNEQEQDFLEKYVTADDTVAQFIKANGIKQFGLKRVEEILQVKKNDEERNE